jgi:hypothetical protein
MLPSRPPASQIKKTPFSFPAAIAQTNKSKKKKKKEEKKKRKKKRNRPQGERYNAGMQHTK